MAPIRFWIESMEQASPNRGVDGQIAVVTLTGQRTENTLQQPESF